MKYHLLTGNIPNHIYKVSQCRMSEEGRVLGFKNSWMYCH